MAFVTSFAGRRIAVLIDDGSEKGRRFSMSGINQNATEQDCVDVATAVVEILGEDCMLNTIQDSTTREYLI